MLRAVAVTRIGANDQARVVDRVVLDASERHRRRIVLTGERGSQFLLDLPRATALRDGDGLLLEDGSIVLVAGKPEPVLDIEAGSASELARLAWHLGNRHTDVQILGDRLRIRRDHVLQDMLRHLGARVTARDAPFDPESGAYGQPIGQLAPHGAPRPHTHAHHHAGAPAHAHSHAPGQHRHADEPVAAQAPEHSAGERADPPAAEHVRPGREPS